MRAEDFDPADLVRFDPSKGALYIAGHRHLLFGQHALAKLRRLLCDQLGFDLARSILFKFGYQNAQTDYSALSKAISWDSPEDLLRVGPMMHAWSGAVRVDVESLEFDRDKNHFHFKGTWANSYEAEIHLKEFGLSQKPVCFSLAGYGSGWCSSFFGIPLLEVETQCVAMGHPHCRWEIKPWNQWGEEASAYKSALAEDQFSLIRTLEKNREKLESYNQRLELEVKNQTSQIEYLLRIVCHDLKVPLMMLEEASKNSNSDTSNSEVERRLAIKLLRHSLAQAAEHVKDRARPKSSNHQIGSWRDLRRCIQTSCEIFRSQIQQKGITVVDLTNDAQEALDIPIPAVPHIPVLQQILNNLMGNAVKFSPYQSRITIDAEIEATQISLMIRDQGSGISEAIIQQIKNNQAVVETDKLADSSGGIGMGLGIARETSASFGWGMEIHSKPLSHFPLASGTSIILKIPRG